MSILISPQEAMTVLGVGHNKMYCNLLVREDFPAFKMDGRWYVNKSKLQEWADNQCNKNKEDKL
ncbi:helix-turn-helix domain-containing protein [Clostridium paraputrificum]|uniref:helix-turn-helix domain-containing protein n=1 Tax=Clostridium paraputrificum TaxID=29363 RepID=UPI00374F86C4